MYTGRQVNYCFIPLRVLLAKTFAYFAFKITADQELVYVFIFKLEEEGKPALLLLLPVLFAESAVLVLEFGLGCILVVATAQVVYSWRKVCCGLFSSRR
jgi:hypothetical protein